MHRAAATMLALRNGRFTPARQFLVDTVAVAERPLTAAEIATSTGLPTSSVYRNLAMLVEAGVLASIPGFDRQERFEIGPSLTSEHRHHLVCVRCGMVVDYTAPAPLEALVARLTPRLAEARGFELQGHTLDLLGVCQGCTSSGVHHVAGPAGRQQVPGLFEIGARQTRLRAAGLGRLAQLGPHRAFEVCPHGGVAVGRECDVRDHP